MKILCKYVSLMLVGLAFAACQKSEEKVTSKAEISQDALAKIKNLGFSTDGIRAVPGGFLVEGDIFLKYDQLDEIAINTRLRTAGEEQYSTNNKVSGTRTITISVTNLPDVYSNAANAAIERYNAEELRLTFQRVSSGGNINIVGFDEARGSDGFITLGSAGFPSGGNPYNEIKMNVNQDAYGSNPDLDYLTGIIAHEMGHCIGFRHTDYYNRAFSCGGRKTNEGSSSVGAVLIPGTPSKAQSDSWMLACSNGEDRPFNFYDKKALEYLYSN